MEALVRVRFTSGHSPYQAGEVAGFYPATALLLVQRGVAVFVEPPREPDTGPREVEHVKTTPPVDKMVRAAAAVTKRPESERPAKRSSKRR